MKRLKLFWKRFKEVQEEISNKGLAGLNIKQLLEMEGKYAELLTEDKVRSD